MHQVKQNRGSALLTALFIMTLVAIVATAMTIRLQMDIYRTRLIVNHDKLYLASQAVMFWALSELDNKNLPFIKSDKEGVVDLYPKKMETIVNQVKITGRLYDLQSRFNLNNLIDKKYEPLFIRLTSNTTSKLNHKEQLDLALAVEDWLYIYDIARGEDEYTYYYLSQKPPYYPSHQLMHSTSELRLVKFVSAETYQALQPFITVLPETTPININTASIQLIMSLGKGFTQEQANEIISARGRQGIKDLKDIDELTKRLKIPNELISIESKYFLSEAFVSSEEFKLTVYTLLKRSRDKDKKISVQVIRQSINGY
jgi:general secretion pathway protein K